MVKRINQIRNTQMSERSTSVDLDAAEGLVSVYKGIKSMPELTDNSTGIARIWKLS